MHTQITIYIYDCGLQEIIFSEFEYTQMEWDMENIKINGIIGVTNWTDMKNIAFKTNDTKGKTPCIQY